MVKRTFESSFASLFAPACEDEFLRVHASEMLRSLKPEAIVSASDNDRLPCEVCVNNWRNGIALVFDKLNKRETHIVVFNAEKLWVYLRSTKR